MKRTIKVRIMAAILFAASAAYTNHVNADAGRGAFFGGLSGATLGGIFGGGRGAAIGAGVGLATGAIAGAAADRDRGGYYTLDYMGYPYWEVKNSTGFPILVRASGDSFIQIMPDNIAQIPRGKSFKFYAKAYSDPRKRPSRIRTRNHYIEVTTSGRGQIRINSWNN